ncbi:hypothetical protein AB0C44_20490 [Micromonospora taraxaci]|uniref:hypothetical protein n=1 Tax=Micromonospora taraxaci TaxID=1316803 RepID=UPI0033C26EBE
MTRKGMACPLVWSTVPARWRSSSRQWKSQVPSVTGWRLGDMSRPTAKSMVPSPHHIEVASAETGGRGRKVCPGRGR